MSKEIDTNDARAQIASGFGLSPDKLAELSPQFEEMDVDPFAVYEAEIFPARDYEESTEESYRCVFGQWKDHMAEEDRHPACPGEQHIKSFIAKERERGCQDNTIEGKIYQLNSAYEFWQKDGHFPHPMDYNPFLLALETTNLDQPDLADPPYISLEELRERIRGIKNIRDRAVVVTQLKLGLRATELSNIKLAEVNLANSQVRGHYDQMATHPLVQDRPNSIYIPDDRKGNKSKRPRVLPLDDDMRKVLREWLLIRPDVTEPWVFLSNTNLDKITRQGVNGIWKRHFHPDYDGEGESYRAISSHYGRHRFTTHWDVEVGLNRELIMYMRGDKFSSDRRTETMDDYVHTYYEDVEPVYRDQMYRLLSVR